MVHVLKPKILSIIPRQRPLTFMDTNLTPLPPWFREEMQAGFERRQEAILCSSNGLPNGSSSVCLKCGRPGFDPWVRKIPWRRQWHPTPVPLPGKSHGQKSLIGYSPCDCGVGQDWATSLHFKKLLGNSAAEVLEHVWVWGHRNILLLGISSYCYSTSTNNWETVLEQVYNTAMKGRDAVSWLYHSKMPVHSWAGLWRPVFGPYCIPSSPGVCGQIQSEYQP